MKQRPTLEPDPGPFADACDFRGEGSPGPAACLAALLDGDAASSLRRAHALLGELSLVELARQPAAQLLEQHALGGGEAQRLEAALQLCSHLRITRQPRRPAMQSARQVQRYLGARLAGLQRETLQALLLDGKHRLLRLATISLGTLTTSQVHPREVFRPAIRHAAAGLILVHNHPSGDPEPSLEDIAVTRRILEVSSLVGIPLLDHVILGHGSYVSLRERLSLPWSQRR